MEPLNFDNVCMRPDEVDVVIYHGGCSDGFTAAMAGKLFFERGGLKKELVYYGGVFDRAPAYEEIKDKCVLVVDFSYPMSVMTKLLGCVKKVLILDHHKSAMEDLKELPVVNKVFHMGYSGAYISWRYFFREGDVPLMVRYVQDNDLWLKEMDSTNEVSAYIYSLGFVFEEYEKLLDDAFIKNDVIPMGRGMVKQNNSIIANAVKHVDIKFIRIGGKYYFVGILNGTTLKSELGNKIMVAFANVNFAAIYSHNNHNGTTHFSLRSLKTASDVSGIAKVFGGGGHAQSSGLTLSVVTNMLPVEIVSGYKTYAILENVYEGVLVSDGETWNVAYLNSAHYQYQLAKYLMQVRYEGKETVQECASILKNFVKYNMCFVWNYDGVGKCTWFTGNVVGDNRAKIIAKLRGIANLKSFDEGKDKLVLCIEGLVNKL
ncbi:MAG: DHH family phosphohydrolase [Hyperionvirus sp.]|uniref:DHH family phosphohydrolase n=1 Tax=Hyperionvirus sp. TaxID=2487770 RepID=A0A3G5ABK4_9VIRU|nr:MAG: DHH family phosphohydrolase [Hyperionvirus sp.]